jgi:hypothetical protein
VPIEHGRQRGDLSTVLCDTLSCPGVEAQRILDDGTGSEQRANAVSDEDRGSRERRSLVTTKDAERLSTDSDPRAARHPIPRAV